MAGGTVLCSSPYFVYFCHILPFYYFAIFCHILSHFTYIIGALFLCDVVSEHAKELGLRTLTLAGEMQPAHSRAYDLLRELTREVDEARPSYLLTISYCCRKLVLLYIFSILSSLMSRGMVTSSGCCRDTFSLSFYFILKIDGVWFVSMFLDCCQALRPRVSMPLRASTAR